MYCLITPTWSPWDLPIMTEGICPNIPGSLLWPSNQVPGMAICDKTGLLGAAVHWPSCGSEDWLSVSADVRIPGLSSYRASPGGFVAPEPLPCSSSSITHSWESPSCSSGLRFTATKPLLAAPSSGSGVAVPEWSLLQEGVCCPCPLSGMDFSPTWERTGRCLPKLKQHYCACKGFCQQQFYNPSGLKYNLVTN